MNKSYKIDWGPLKTYITDEDITDIMYSDNEVWVTSIHYGLKKADVLIDEDFIEVVCNKLASNMNVYFNAAKPELDAEIDGLRINAIHSGSAPSGIVLAIRKTPKVCKIDLRSAIESGYGTEALFNFLKKVVQARCNILISGETGTGKTELVKFLFRFSNMEDRAITIEDTLELHLKHLYPTKNIVSLKANKSASIHQLVRSCLRQNPDWILVSESRGKEVKDMLNSIATGHSIITTLHSENASMIPTRIQFMSDDEIRLRSIHQLLDIGIHLKLKKLNDGKQYRFIDEVVEFYVDSSQEVKVNKIYDGSSKRISKKLSIALMTKLGENYETIT